MALFMQKAYNTFTDTFLLIRYYLPVLRYTYTSL